MLSPALGAWRLAAGEVHRRRGELERAFAQIDEELEIVRGAELTHAVGGALCLRGRCEGGRAGIERLREAVATLERTEARLEHARALIDLGATLRPANRRGTGRAELGEARECLRLGVDLAQRCSATPLVEQGQAEL